MAISWESEGTRKLDSTVESVQHPGRIEAEDGELLRGRSRREGQKSSSEKFPGKAADLRERRHELYALFVP